MANETSEPFAVESMSEVGVDNKVSKVPPDTLIACDVDYCNLDEDVITVGVKITMMRIRNMVMYMKKC